MVQPVAEPQADLASDAAGLSSAEGRSRRNTFGPNLFRAHRERPLLVQFLSRFRNPLVILLLVASTISALTGEMTSFAIITVMVLFSVTLDFVQEYRAGEAAESLCQSVSVRALVIRGGKSMEVPVSDVVPGDLAVLSTGDMVPADGLVLEAHDLFVKQALLTGESYPVEKRPGVLAADATELQDAAHAVFMGTTVISGSARMRVVRTGSGTAIGAIADSITRQPPLTAFEIGPISSAFDFLTFFVLLVVLRADEALFQTGWFVESLSTQVLLIFIIRTRGNPFRSRPHPVLVATSLAVVAIGATLPFTPLGTYFGFVPPPAQFYAILAVMVVIYLLMVEVAKRGFYRWYGGSGKPSRATGAVAKVPGA